MTTLQPIVPMDTTVLPIDREQAAKLYDHSVNGAVILVALLRSFRLPEAKLQAEQLVAAIQDMIELSDQNTKHSDSNRLGRPG